MAIDPFGPGSFLHSRRGVPIQKAEYSRSKDWLLAIADKMAPAVRRAFLEAVEAVRKTIPEKRLRELLAAGDVATILREMRVEQAMDNILRGSFVSAILSTLQTAGQESAVRFPRAMLRAPALSAELQGLFTMVNPRTVEFLNRYSADLVKGVSSETARAISDVVKRAVEQGGPIPAQARQIRELVGLLPKQAAAVEAYREALVEAGNSPDKVAKATARYAKRLLTSRATTIARTETIRAANAGQTATWDEAVARGLIDADVRREWIVTWDDRLCPHCRAIPSMNKQGRRLGEPFETPIGPALAPPLHPNCRCALSLKV